MGARPDRRVRRTRTAVEDALIALVIEKGYHAVTVGEIIERADVSRSTFYTHYTDKQAVLLACLDRLHRLLGPPPDTGTQQRVFGEGLFAHVDEHRALYRAFTGRRAPVTQVQARLEQLLTRTLRQRLTGLLAADATPPVPPDIVVRATVGAYLALLTAWLDDELPTKPSATDMESLFHTFAEPAITTALGLPHGTL
ncbi:TetR/AcrR family transcriptional regulator [Nocardia terpenica]|uniref:TetR/AcrR family transcriptional regulator n=1 Tax=Nocardia terpenica TaxID=455432 RepID=UPI0015587E54|nr:TetR/AcrR family transcriptional regulator [Nocardia terpenica]NQE93366.1 TetR/AcrR family transcriptional regulator [Nocardia terpenica]